MKFLLTHSMRVQADLVDQLFNSSEKRLARILLLMAEFGEPGEQETLIPKISQETLAEMIGTTRSRVSFFMNRFREHGFIDYKDRIHVHRSLLNVILHDQLPDDQPKCRPLRHCPLAMQGRQRNLRPPLSEIEQHTNLLNGILTLIP
jgi:CRP/FNR family cyclic AMP-dependent transcriptional regulator